MKDYKWLKGLGFMALCALGGGILGGGLNMVMSKVSPSVAKEAFYQFAPNLFWVALVCGIMGISGYFYFNSLLKKDGYSNEEGSVFDRYENKMSVIMTLSTICAIFNFTAFGLNLNASGLSNVYGIIFMINVILSFMGEVANISLVKKVRPELNADPLSTKFRKDYFDQLDECEKIKTGKASVKAMNAMVVVYVSVFVLCWILVMGFEVSPVICLPVGVLWLVQTVLMLYHNCKQS